MEERTERERAVRVLSLSVTELAEALRRQTLNALEVMKIYRARAIEIDRACNAAFYWFDDAEKLAREADEHLKLTGRPLGPLHGVPFTIKDHIAASGSPMINNTLMAKKALDERRKKGKRAGGSAEDPLVTMLKSLGAIPLAKTTMAQIGDAWSCGGPGYGDTLNPWDTLRTTGGSSGGEGALIGGGASPFGIGSDVGGSLRIPAAFNGICTLKPTTNRVCSPLLPVPGEYSIPATLGLMAKTVDDLVFLHSLVLSDELHDKIPRLLRSPFRTSEASSARPLRIGYFIQEYTQPNPCPTARRAMQEVIQALRSAGHEVVQYHPHSDGVLRIGEYRGCANSLRIANRPVASKGDRDTAKAANGGTRTKEDALRAKVLPAWLGNEEPIHPDLAAWADPPDPNAEVEGFTFAGSTRGPMVYLQLMERRDQLRTRFYEAFQRAGLDVLVCPAWGLPAPQIEEVRNLAMIIDTTRIWNFLDMPVGVVPVTSVTAEDLRQPYDPAEGVCGGPPSERIVAASLKCLQGAEGLPMAVQVVGLPWREELVLRGMREVEAGCPFQHRQHARLEPIPRRSPTLGARPEPMPKARL